MDYHLNYPKRVDEESTRVVWEAVNQIPIRHQFVCFSSIYLHSNRDLIGSKSKTMKSPRRWLRGTYICWFLLMMIRSWELIFFPTHPSRIYGEFSMPPDKLMMFFLTRATIKKWLLSLLPTLFSLLSY